ncbi:uncharacterized protein LOC111259393 isoform X2 [Varroa jacobsoni]|uniref:uncharacterized protein LOC111259393 isoform X2 n=1 Tax=Varroa jacobsoni TaxID=62625 RepID=UPI000BF8D51C|nr:uncharacterized protein LOC111259393 isoform X2 [Varroa jacobsoni]
MVRRGSTYRVLLATANCWLLGGNGDSSKPNSTNSAGLGVLSNIGSSSSLILSTVTSSSNPLRGFGLTALDNSTSSTNSITNPTSHHTFSNKSTSLLPFSLLTASGHRHWSTPQQQQRQIYHSQHGGGEGGTPHHLQQQQQLQHHEFDRIVHQCHNLQQQQQQQQQQQLASGNNSTATAGHPLADRASGGFHQAHSVLPNASIHHYVRQQHCLQSNSLQNQRGHHLHSQQRVDHHREEDLVGGRIFYEGGRATGGSSFYQLVAPAAQMVHPSHADNAPGNGPSTQQQQNSSSTAPLMTTTSAAMALSQNIQLETSSYVGSPESGSALTSATGLDPSSVGNQCTLSSSDLQEGSSTVGVLGGWSVNVTSPRDHSFTLNSQIITTQNNHNLTIENRLISEDSLYSTLGPDLTGSFSSTDILEYLPGIPIPCSLEDSKRSSDPSDSQGLMWELEPDEVEGHRGEASLGGLSKIGEEPDKLWSSVPGVSQQLPMEFDVNSVFKTDIKSESLAEPTLAELNANEDEDQILEGFDVSSFFMDSHDHDKPMTVTTSSNLSNSSPISMTSGNGGKNLDMFGQHLTSSQLSTVQDIKMEPTTVLGSSASRADSGGGPLFADLMAGTSSSSGLHTLSPPSSSQMAAPLSKDQGGVQAGPGASSSGTLPGFLNPLPPSVYALPLSSSFPSTSSGIPGKQHLGGGKAASRSFLHPSRVSPSHSPARKSPLGLAGPGGGKPKGSLLADRLSTSAPSTNAVVEQMWKARKAEVQRTGRLRHGSTDTTLSQLSSVQLTMDEGFSSQADEEDDSDNDDHSSGDDSGGSDAEQDGVRSPLSPASLNSDEPSIFAGSSKKKGKYFWQYNVQAKGPKGPRMKVTNVPADPHVLADVTDPVFSPDCQLEGVKHAGKARRGDGNDLTPNANKLYNIGVELKKLNRVINELTPPTDVPFNARNKSRKEKNKLASRACRLKKKAQHEANKLKLYGLQQEHKRLLETTVKMRQLCTVKAQGLVNPEEQKQTLDAIIHEADSHRVAGHSADYVNRILRNVAAGVPRGGIDL